MPDIHLPDDATLAEKVDYFYIKLEEKFPKEKIKSAIEYLTYKKVSPLPKTESSTKPTLYIFRHGESEDNIDMIFSGWRDAKITEKGRKQALILAEKIKDKKIQMLISSDQIRAKETMELAVSLNKSAKDLPIEIDERIKERSYGDLQGTSKLEMYFKNPKKLQEYRRSFKGVPPNGESIEMVCERVGKFCEEIVPLMKEHDINVAVSCHGNSIRGFRRYFESLSDFDTAHVETPLAKDYLAYVIK